MTYESLAEVAPDPMNQDLQRLSKLTTDLEDVLASSAGGEDSDVRDHVCAVLQGILIEGNVGAPMPLFFGLFNPVTSFRLRRIMKRFACDKEIVEFVQSTPRDERIALLKSALAEDRVVSDRGTPMTEILGEWV